MPDHPSDITEVPGTGDFVATAPQGVSIVDGPDEEDDRDFVQPRMRTAGTVALGISQSIDNSEGGVSKTFFPQIMIGFGLGDSALGLLNALGSGARMLFGPVWAMAADKWGRKRILFVVTGLWGLWTIATGFATSWPMLLVLYSIALIGTVAGEPILNGLLGSLYRRSERGKAFGLVRGTSSALGFIITPLIGQFGGNPQGWRYAMIAMGVLSVVSGILILIFVHEPQHVATDDREELKSDAGMFKLSDAPKLFNIPTLTLIALMLPFVTSLVLFGFQAQVWARNLGYGVTNASYLATVFQIGAMISAFLGGWLGDRFTKVFGNKGRIMLFQIYALAFGLIVALVMYVPQWWDPDVTAGNGQVVTNSPSILYYVMVFLMGLVFSIGFSGCVLPMVSSVCPKPLASTSFAVLFSLIQGALTTVYSLIVGGVAQAIGNLQLTLLIAVTVPYWINAIFWFLFYRTYDKDVHLQAERSRAVTAGTF